MTPDDALLAQAVARGVVPQDLAARARLEAAALAAQGRPIGAVAIVIPHLTAEQATALRALAGSRSSRLAVTQVSDRLPGQQQAPPSGPSSGRVRSIDAASAASRRSIERLPPPAGDSTAGPPPRTTPGEGGVGVPRPGASTPSDARPRRDSSGRLVGGALRPGDQVGAYVLQEELGKGGMGVVWRARHPGLGREVALKLVGGASVGERARERSRLEAEAVARLRHPGIVAVHDVGEHEGRPFLVMELVQGAPISARVEAEGPLPPRDAATLARDVARALHHAHERQVLHRDVKPDNILVDPQGRAIVVDFGLAKLGAQDGQPDGLRGPTQTGQIVGTPGFMAPEQASRELVQDARTDVYGLGATLFSLLTSRPPFEGDSLLVVLAGVANRDAEPPSRVRAIVARERAAARGERRPRRRRATREAKDELDRDLDTVVLRCLEKDPARRYPSAEALAADLDRWLAGEPVLARPVTGAERALKWARRNRAAVVLGIATAGLLLAGGVAGLVLRAQAAIEEAERREQASRQELDVRARESTARREAAEAERAAAALRASAAATDAWAACDGGVAGARSTGLALRALTTAQRWRDAGGGEPAARAQHRAALALAEVARASAQWDLAVEAAASALGLGLGPEAEEQARSAAEDVEVSRQAEDQRRRQAVEGVLARVLGGEARAREGGLTDAVFELTRYPDLQTVGLLAARLDAAGRALVRAEGQALRAAGAPTAEEAAGGEGLLSRLDEAVAWRERNVFEGEPVDLGLAQQLSRALQRLAGRRRLELRTAADLRGLQAELQRGGLSDLERDVVQVASEALGRLGLRADAAILPLDRYLAVEADELRAVPAGLALVRLGAMDRITRHREEGRFDFRGVFWERVSRAFPQVGEERAACDEPAALRTRAELRAKQGDPQGAIDDLTRALALAPDDPTLYMARGWVYSVVGRDKDALADQRRAVELAPTEATAWSNLARCLTEVGEVQAAAQAYDRALAIDGRLAVIWSNRGRFRRDRLGDRKGAIEDLSRAIQLEPGSAEHRLQRGLTHAYSNELPQARADFDAALERDPDSTSAHANRGRVNLLEGRFDDAIADLDASIGHDPTQGVFWFTRGCARRGKRDLVGATGDLTRAWSLGLLDALVARAEVHDERGDVVAATADWELVRDRAAPGSPALARAQARLSKK